MCLFDGDRMSVNVQHKTVYLLSAQLDPLIQYQHIFNI
ncbi:hypothetical protein PTI45_02469 [Paenibacillus nuruki]|uniref:Uncharacterized protein n=1 Tax=Paenibacillus nuruki TaxID=1886670 RepID=A0A1E3L389_9BACL|nr:hypothetical protein PTI45_02469 [Paenibacillus nuruki]CAJ1314497.1 Transposase [Paenibacillus nuruki]